MSIIPFNELLPASAFPLGQESEGSLACHCGVVMINQSCTPPRSIGQPCGRWMFGSACAAPASIAYTVPPPSSSRQMITLPAEPVPTMM
jgi:hypothetical protein